MIGFLAGIVIPVLFIFLVAGVVGGEGRKLRPEEMPVGYIKRRR